VYVFKPKNRKTWSYRFRVNGISYQGGGFLSKTAARNVGERKRAQVLEGTYKPRKKKIPFRRLAKEYLKLAKHKSVENDKYLSKHLLSYFGSYNLDQITPHTLERYRDKRLKEHPRCGKKGFTSGKTISPATVNREMGLLRRMFNAAIRWGWADSNPVSKIKMLKERPDEPHCLDYKEEARLLSHCPPQVRDIVIMALETGMRRGELVSLKWKDVDMDKEIIQVSAVKSKGGYTRYIPMTRGAFDVLDKLQGKGECEYVFLNKEGKPYRDGSSIHAQFNRAVKKAGLDNLGVTFHSLRHTFISRAIMAGLPESVVMKLVGHKDFRMIKRYTHLSPGYLRGSIERLEQFNYAQRGDQGGDQTIITAVEEILGSRNTRQDNKLPGGRSRIRTGDLLHVRQGLGAFEPFS